MNLTRRLQRGFRISVAISIFGHETRGICISEINQDINPPGSRALWQRLWGRYLIRGVEEAGRGRFRYFFTYRSWPRLSTFTLYALFRLRHSTWKREVLRFHQLTFWVRECGSQSSIRADFAGCAREDNRSSVGEPGWISCSTENAGRRREPPMQRSRLNRRTIEFGGQTTQWDCHTEFCETWMTVMLHVNGRSFRRTRKCENGSNSMHERSL